MSAQFKKFKGLMIPPEKVEIPELADGGVDGLIKRFPEKEAQIRAALDPRATTPIPDDFMASVRRSGVQKPALVILLGTERDEDVYMIVDGRHRRRGLVDTNAERAEAGLPPRMLPCAVKTITDAATIRMMKGATSVTVPLSPLFKARQLREMISTGTPELEAGEVFGITTKQGVRDLLSLLDAPAEVQAAVESGKITQSCAVEVVRSDAPPEVQRERVAEIAAKGLRGSRAKAVAREGRTDDEGGKSRKRVEIRRLISALEGMRPRECKSHEQVKAMIAALRWALGEDADSLGKRAPDLLVALELKKEAA